jgi:K+-transporting ATPase A subunit
MVMQSISAFQSPDVRQNMSATLHGAAQAIKKYTDVFWRKISIIGVSQRDSNGSKFAGFCISALFLDDTVQFFLGRFFPSLF